MAAPYVAFDSAAWVSMMMVIISPQACQDSFLFQIRFSFTVHISMRGLGSFAHCEKLDEQSQIWSRDQCSCSPDDRSGRELLALLCIFQARQAVQDGSR